MKRLFALAFFVLALSNIAYGKDKIKVTNEMIYEKLLEIEKRQAVLEAQFKGFKEQVDKRFEQIDKRFEQVDKRFSELRQDINERFHQLYTFLWIITGIFTTMVVAVIGFAYWDRRTIVRKARDEAFEKVEIEGKWRLILQALRELAKENKKLAEILRNFGLL